MLSYQHAYHAGNLADIHKHQFLAKTLTAMVQKDKAMAYIETHAGRGLYDTQSVEALKTGEAAVGIDIANIGNFEKPYQDVIATIKSEYGTHAYPGSPMVAANILRSFDILHLAELHPQEFKALRQNTKGDKRIRTHHQDGFDMALSVTPPTPKRGLMLIDPSYEIKSEYFDIPKRIAQIHKRWNTGTIILWYPILPSGAHTSMISALDDMDFPKTHKDEVMFDSGLDNHRLKGSGLYIINMPWMGE